MINARKQSVDPVIGNPYNPVTQGSNGSKSTTKEST